MLAIMQALEEWQHFLKGTPKRFDIFTDHKNLAYFCDAQKLNWWQAQWSLDLSPFHFSLIHQLGQLMWKADALSRRAGHAKGEEDNKDMSLLPTALFKLHALESASALLDGPGA